MCDLCDPIKQKELMNVQRECYFKILDSCHYYFKTFNISNNDFFDLLDAIEYIYYNFYKKNK